MSIDRGMGKEDVVHIHNGLLLSRKKNEITFTATWMDLEIIILSEISQKKTSIISFYLYVESKKMMIQMHLLSRNRLTNIGFFLKSQSREKDKLGV